MGLYYGLSINRISRHLKGGVGCLKKCKILKYDFGRYIYFWKAETKYFLKKKKKKKKITNWHPLSGPKIRPKMLKNQSFTRIDPVTLVFNRFSKCWYQNLRKIT